MSVVMTLPALLADYVAIAGVLAVVVNRRDRRRPRHRRRGRLGSGT